MLTCDRCSAPIPHGARFCSACGDPVTAADLPGRQAARPGERVNLVCPRCETQALHDLPPSGVAACTCPDCRAVFTTRVVTIRSKRSAGNKKQGTRSFTIRVEDLNRRDDLIEFVRPGTEDFELRSRDLAAFSSVDGRLQRVQNLTLGRHMRLAPAQPGWRRSVAVVAVLLLVLLGFCGMLLGDDEPGRSYAPARPHETTAPSVASTPSSGASTPSSGAQSGETFYVHGNLNVRSSPDRSGAILQTLTHGERVQLGPSDENGWAPLYGYAGTREGYVYGASDMVQRQPPAPSRPQTSGGSSGSGYYTGPRGGCYTYSASGRKRYVDRSNCN